MFIFVLNFRYSNPVKAAVVTLTQATDPMNVHSEILTNDIPDMKGYTVRGPKDRESKQCPSD